jgi:hypothetical protein
MKSQACPKCNYLRTAQDTAPDWQCPNCGIAYHKYSAYLDKVKHITKPREAAGPVEPISQDGSIWFLIIANLLVLVISVIQDWNLGNMLLVYCIQSIVIGGSYFMRILSLDKFSTKNFKINNRSVEPTESTKRQTAFFFLLHYGFFHLVYLIFVLSGEFGEPGLDLGLLICAIGFAMNHAYSYRYHRDSDRKGTPNIGTMMFTPYARIIPMHLTIIFGAATFSDGIILFGILKTIADVVMHKVEHHILSSTSG